MPAPTYWVGGGGKTLVLPPVEGKTTGGKVGWRGEPGARGGEAARVGEAGRGGGDRAACGGGTGWVGLGWGGRAPQPREGDAPHRPDLCGPVPSPRAGGVGKHLVTEGKVVLIILT